MIVIGVRNIREPVLELLLLVVLALQITWLCTWDSKPWLLHIPHLPLPITTPSLTGRLILLHSHSLPFKGCKPLSLDVRASGIENVPFLLWHIVDLPGVLDRMAAMLNCGHNRGVPRESVFINRVCKWCVEGLGELPMIGISTETKPHFHARVRSGNRDITYIPSPSSRSMISQTSVMIRPLYVYRLPIAS